MGKRKGKKTQPPPPQPKNPQPGGKSDGAKAKLPLLEKPQLSTAQKQPGGKSDGVKAELPLLEKPQLNTTQKQPGGKSDGVKAELPLHEKPQPGGKSDGVKVELPLLEKPQLNYATALSQPLHGRGVSTSETINIETKLGFWFDKKTRFGRISDWNLPIYTEDENRSESVSSGIVHQYYLPVVGTFSKKTKEEVQYLTIHHAFHKSFQNLLAEHPIVKTYIIPSLDDYPPLVNPISYTYLTNKFRSFFRGIIQFIGFLHKKNSSYSDTLELEKNFVGHDGMLKMCCLSIFKSSSGDKKEDFRKLATILEEHVFNGRVIPKEVKHLLDCMKSYNPRRDHVLLENHLAVLQTRERLDLIKAFHERSKDHGGDNVLNNSYTYANMINVDWTERLRNNDPALGYALTAYNRQDGADGEKKHIYHIKDYNNVEVLNQMAIKYARNMASHMLEYMKTGSKEDVEIIIMEVVGDQLLSFQKEAHACQALKYILE